MTEAKVITQEEVDRKYLLITRGLQEVIDPDGLMKKILAKRDLVIYWGTAPTGVPSIGYFCPMNKLADLLNAGCEVIVLLADLHAFLDSAKSSLETVESRTKVYELVIRAMLTALDVDLTKAKLRFVVGSSFQKTPEYFMDLMKLGNQVPIHDAQNAGTEVVKKNDNPLTTSLIYPLMQALDEVHLKVDCQIGGVDQRKIFMLARDFLPRIGYKKRIHMMNPIISALSPVATKGEIVKMSSSDKNSKISVLDTPKNIRKKINSAFCEEGNAEDNTVLTLLKGLLWPILENKKMTFKIERLEQFGGPVEYKDFDKVFKDFADKKLHPNDLKQGIIELLIKLTEPVKLVFEDKTNKLLLTKAYTQAEL
jgi:tyrosyl-tRNA synthetase